MRHSNHGQALMQWKSHSLLFGMVYLRSISIVCSLRAKPRINTYFEAFTNLGLLARRLLQQLVLIGNPEISNLIEINKK